MTKQCLYQCVEDLFRIYLDFMGEYYGERLVDMETPAEVKQAAAFAGAQVEDEIQMPFDFAMLKNHPMTLKLDVGASSYYSEIASMQTLDNLLMNGHINVIQYLERIPDGYIPARRALIAELQNQQMAMQAQMPQGMNPEGIPDGAMAPPTAENMEVEGGKGFGALQRKVLQEGVNKV